MIFCSAGHIASGKDPGAIANGYKEADLTKRLRDQTLQYLKAMGAKYISDIDTETLQQYLTSIKTGEGSVVCEYHFNAGPPSANGIEVIVPDNATPLELELARELCNVGASIGLRNRGVKREKDTARGKLALMRESGINVLIEVCFLTNENDLEIYFKGSDCMASKNAILLKKYDDMIA